MRILVEGARTAGARKVGKRTCPRCQCVVELTMADVRPINERFTMFQLGYTCPTCADEVAVRVGRGIPERDIYEYYKDKQ